MELITLDGFRRLRDAEGVIYAVEQLRSRNYPLEEVQELLKAEGYNPRVTRFFWFVTLHFTNEQRRQAYMEMKRARDDVNLILTQNLPQARIKEITDNLQTKTKAYTQSPIDDHRVRWHQRTSKNLASQTR